MHYDITRFLPKTSFLPFECHRLANPTIYWRNRDDELVRDLDEHAYCVPLATEPESAYLRSSKTYWAERYGGCGIAKNGGGARCGLRGDSQIKGIGPNPVTGVGSGFWYSHGAASLQEGIREAIWGEICHIALPYGGTRVRGLICTGTQSPYNSREGGTMAPRTLIVRENALRPAHYMRAVYFQPSISGLLSDTARTSAAIQLFQSSLQSVLGISLGSRGPTLSECLIAMADRIAEQLSTARAKRIMHGALNCSNICIDGAWIDYGTITTLSDYGRFIVANNNPDLWRQHHPIARTFTEIIFYLRKYLKSNETMNLIEPLHLINHFEKTLARDLALQYVRLLGAPLAVCRALDDEMLNSVEGCFNRIIMPGNLEPFKLSPYHVVDMPSKTGRYSLNKIIRLACVCDSEQTMDAAILHEISDNKLRGEFCHIFCSIRKIAVMTVSDKRRGIIEIQMLFDALRFNASFEDLYRPNLDRSINRAIDEPREITNLFNDLLAKAATILGERSDGLVDLGGIMSASAKYDSINLLLDTRKLKLHEKFRLIESVKTSVMSISSKNQAKQYAIQSS